MEIEEAKEQLVEVEEENPNMEEEGAKGTNEMVEGEIVRENGMQDMLEEGTEQGMVKEKTLVPEEDLDMDS